VRGHNFYVLGPGSKVGGSPYQQVFGSPDTVPTITEDDYRRMLAALPKAEAPEAERPANSVRNTNQTPRPDAARKYLDKAPGTTAGLGVARCHCYFLCNLLAHHFALDFPAALELLCTWGSKDSNVRAADGAYYPWTRKELAASLRNAYKHGKAMGKQGGAAHTLDEARREAAHVAALFDKVRPDHTKPDRSHKTGYRVRAEHYEDIGTVILHLRHTLPEDCSNPCARAQAFYSELWEAGEVRSPWNHQRYMVVRDFLSDLGLLDWYDSTYRPGWFKAGGGQCCRCAAGCSREHFKRHASKVFHTWS
jgi:hypothetical protein